MTTLLITPNPDRKTARFKGTIAAGEHVSVTVKDGAEWNEEGLTLRVIDFTTMRTLAVFPRPAEVLEDGEEPDAWGTTQSGDLTCTLNLNTVRMVNAARHMIHVPVLFVLGNSDEDSRTLYFRDRYEVELWPERIGDDVPYDLDKWPKQIDEWTDQMDEWARQMQTFGAALTAEAEARASGDAPLSGQIINTNTTNALRQAVKTIGAALGATMRVLAVCAALPLLGATVRTAPLGDLDLDQNPSVVTNVTLDGLAQSSNTYSKAETDAKIVELAPPPGNYNAVSNAAMSAAAQTNDFLRLTGGGRIKTSEYDFIIGYDSTFAPRSGIWWQGLAAQCGIGCDSLLGNLILVNEGYWISLPRGSGTLTLRSDLAAAADAATNYTDWAIQHIDPPIPVFDVYAADVTNVAETVTSNAISTNNAAFVEAVLAAPLTGADPSDLSEIGEYGSYGTIGAAILALIAGLAALKRGKADKTELPYDIVAVAPSNGVVTVGPRTISTYTAGDSAAAFTVAVGTGETGKARDCELVIDCTATGAVAPTVTWPNTFHPRTDAEDFACDAGVRNVYYISEYATGQYVVGGWQETTGGNA